MSFLALALAAGLLSQTPGQAQDPASGPVAELGDVVVEGRRLRSVVQSFVGEVTAPATSDRGPARWNGPVCIGVVNLRAEVAQYIVDRASDVARELGLEAGEPGCAANVLIIAAADGQAVADGIVEERRRAFVPGGSGMTRTLSALEDFRTSDAPVRWWHVSAPVDSESGELATRLPGRDAPQIAVSRASRIRTDIRDDLFKAIIVVDISKVDSISLPQLADYCTLIALAQVDPKAEVASFETILNVFIDPTITGLTSWDRDYLAALYGIEQNRLGSARGGEIVDLMMRGVRADPVED
ncbi:hypothetical protein [Brevundimonas sp.]|uniref:hypothetical protein n=1 Tax=Brevundimonas sp. TaxID=1871086 RepID=UPI0026220FA4|nr:hypothetical protein [Brevundimonas sp.]